MDLVRIRDYCAIDPSSCEKINFEKPNTPLAADVRAALQVAARLGATIGRIAQLGGVSFPNADLRAVSLVGASLIAADFRGSNLAYSNLTRADLHGADLSGVDLTAASLSAANLAGASLVRARLRDASLADAILTGADLSGADLRGVAGMTADQIRKVAITDQTTLFD
ncbi:pentapeptide repeat-containing protein [Nonomuraea sp. NPDC050643]|uniref:pentapeptide repeat-containing protein n=1 Tax=Nonomuraea sp. NPDC050643 TaxID=3155660 RepID=UPI0033EE8E1F